MGRGAIAMTGAMTRDEIGKVFGEDVARPLSLIQACLVAEFTGTMTDQEAEWAAIRSATMLIGHMFFGPNAKIRLIVPPLEPEVPTPEELATLERLAERTRTKPRSKFPLPKLRWNEPNDAGEQ